MPKSPIDSGELLAAVEECDNSGFCITCGNHQYGCEPDAREYTCEVCDEPTVYGAEELLMMGYVE